jgi:hypothetical protein
MEMLFALEEKYCPKCKQHKKPAEFNKDAGRKDGLYLWCKVCHSSYTSARQKENYDPGKARAKHLKAKYGITEAEYLALYEKQGGVCACCGRAETVFSNKKKDTFHLAVDHDHATGKVRALLCNACNTSLGALDEDIVRIEALLRYARSIK